MSIGPRLEGERLPALIVALGDQALLVRFGAVLSDAANQAAIEFAGRLAADLPDGVDEIDPNLVSVLVRFDPRRITGDRLAGELRLRLAEPRDGKRRESAGHAIAVQFGGEAGPDLADAASALGMTPDDLVTIHNAKPLRVLTTGFAPGFVYCGFHPPQMSLPRRKAVRQRVEPGAVLFAAGQTAIAATAIPTGWHVIGHTAFRNFDPNRSPPTRLREGDFVHFEALP